MSGQSVSECFAQTCQSGLLNLRWSLIGQWWTEFPGCTDRAVRAAQEVGEGVEGMGLLTIRSSSVSQGVIEQWNTCL